jgi:hypothetical protein
MPPGGGGDAGSNGRDSTARSWPGTGKPFGMDLKIRVLFVLFPDMLLAD